MKSPRHRVSITKHLLNSSGYEDERDCISGAPSIITAASVSKDLQEFRKNGANSADVTIVCQEQRLPAHKAILAARSKVFQTMFAHDDTAEAATKLVNIDDVSPEIVDKFLE